METKNKLEKEVTWFTYDACFAYDWKMLYISEIT